MHNLSDREQELILVALIQRRNGLLDAKARLAIKPDAVVTSQITGYCDETQDLIDKLIEFIGGR
jgi:hypothetical protein